MQQAAPAVQEQRRPTPPPQPDRGGMVLNELSRGEMEARRRALEGSQAREMEDRQRAAEDAKRAKSSSSGRGGGGGSNHAAKRTKKTVTAQDVENSHMKSLDVKEEGGFDIVAAETEAGAAAATGLLQGGW